MTMMDIYSFGFWLKLQEHTWNERRKRRIALEEATGVLQDTSFFPCAYDAENNCIYWGRECIELEGYEVDVDAIEERIWKC